VEDRGLEPLTSCMPCSLGTLEKQLIHPGFHGIIFQSIPRSIPLIQFHDFR
jgi:hypothetical protein